MQGSISASAACRDRGRASLRLRLRADRGSALVEIMVSAMLLALVATAVFKGIDGATASSTQSKSRAIAGTLAQEDQERMRAMDPRKLASYSPAPVDRVVNRVKFTIASSAQWVSDRGEAEGCTKGSGRVTYVRISSSVTWPDMTGSKPVTASSIVAISNAYAKGSLAVKIIDRNSAGIPGIPVTVDPPLGQSKDTNDQGCVVWDGLTAGAYFGQFSKTGYVDVNGSEVVRPPNGWNVTTGGTSLATHLYDVAGSVNFEFETKNGTSLVPVNGSGVTVTQTGITGPPTVGYRRETFTPRLAWNFDQLFPFTTPYAAYAGTCDANAPTTGTNWASVTVPVGTLATPNPVKLRMPLLNIRVRRAGTTSTYIQNAHVTVTPVDAACGGTVSWTNATDTSGLLTVAVAQRAFAYGQYTVCADDGSRSVVATIDVQDPNGTPTTILDVPAASTGGGGRGGWGGGGTTAPDTC
jgi:Tfp pilus assembly protein PilV